VDNACFLTWMFVTYSRSLNPSFQNAVISPYRHAKTM
jgi:hypothetical protein